MDFEKFGSIPRLSKECFITEKIDGTNATIYISEDGNILAGSRKRWITPDNDNHGFARWAHENERHLLDLLPPGWHRGEWWGSSINKRYKKLGLEKRFSLFNQSLKDRIEDKTELPFDFVPVIYRGIFTTFEVDRCMNLLSTRGSIAAPGCDDPEGVVIYHVAASVMFKKTFDYDDGKWRRGAR